MTPILSAKFIKKTFDQDVLKDLSLEVMPGEILAIVGMSGAGKSTLLNILGLLDEPDAGELVYTGRDAKAQGQNLLTLPRKVQARFRNLHFGFIFQLYHLLPDLSMLENIMLPTLISAAFSGWGEAKKKSREKGLSLIEELGLSHRAHAHPGELSGGEKQRAAIARALINDPEVVFCDEPTGNLDSENSDKIHNLIGRLNKTRNTTFVIVTHEQDLAKTAHRQLRMVDGRFKKAL